MKLDTNYILNYILNYTKYTDSMIYNSVNIDIWTVMQWYDLIRMMKAIQKCNKKGQLLKSGPFDPNMPKGGSTWNKIGIFCT